MLEIEQEVLQTIGESISAPDVFTDDDAGLAQIRASIGDAVKEMCLLSGCYERAYHLPVFEGRAFYRLQFGGDELGWIREVWDRERKWRLIQTSPAALQADDNGWMWRAGPPERYMPIGTDAVGLYPTPSVSDRVLELRCVMVPEEYSSANPRIKVRDAWRQACIDRAVSDYYASRGDAKRAGEYLERYIESAKMRTLWPQQEERTVQYQSRGGAT